MREKGHTSSSIKRGTVSDDDDDDDDEAITRIRILSELFDGFWSRGAEGD